MSRVSDVKDVLILGGLGVGALVLFKNKDKIGSFFGGIGSSLDQIGQSIGSFYQSAGSAISQYAAEAAQLPAKLSPAGSLTQGLGKFAQSLNPLAGLPPTEGMPTFEGIGEAAGKLAGSLNEAANSEKVRDAINDTIVKNVQSTGINFTGVSVDWPDVGTVTTSVQDGKIITTESLKEKGSLSYLLSRLGSTKN